MLFGVSPNDITILAKRAVLFVEIICANNQNKIKMCSSKLNCSFHASPPSLRYDPHSRPLSNLKPTFILAPCQRINNGCSTTLFEVGFQTPLRRSRGDPTTKIAAVAMLHQNPVVSDLIATGLSGTIALSILRFFAETTKRHVFDQVTPSLHRACHCRTTVFKTTIILLIYFYKNIILTYP